MRYRAGAADCSANPSVVRDLVFTGPTSVGLDVHARSERTASLHLSDNIGTGQQFIGHAVPYSSQTAGPFHRTSDPPVTPLRRWLGPRRVARPAGLRPPVNSTRFTYNYPGHPV